MYEEQLKKLEEAIAEDRRKTMRSKAAARKWLEDYGFMRFLVPMTKEEIAEKKRKKCTR